MDISQIPPKKHIILTLEAQNTFQYLKQKKIQAVNIKYLFIKGITGM